MYGSKDDQKQAFLQNPKPKKVTKNPWIDYVFWTDDRTTRHIMGRSFTGWRMCNFISNVYYLAVKLWTFHFVLYVIMLIIMTGLLIIIYQLIISNDEPYLTGMNSPLALSPGLGMRPRIDFRTALIAYEASDPQTYMPYVQNIRTFVYLYEEVNIKPQDGFATCEQNVKSPDNMDLVCKFYPVEMGLCVKENNYGYDRSQPCVVLKINKVQSEFSSSYVLPRGQSQTTGNIISYI
ncbi:sodium / potassium ATPase beta chain [Opisthorchis viverrini]|uniref:Sodium / potassium ATPase beta chain n=1 Tax=Opisthorchis viverrini TaxID=6198 RepID=A0A1S8X0G5_OPIVI|nr:sodium / potassium ATPase beta chain [Opisthorchis viverrini]